VSREAVRALLALLQGARSRGARVVGVLTVGAVMLGALTLCAVPRPLAAQRLPEAAALAARHDSLVGGRAALEALASLRLLGTFSIPAAGIDAPVEIIKRKPNQYLFRTSLGEVGEVLQGFDGEIAWSVQPGQAPRILQGDELERVREQADFFGDLHDLSRFVSAETVGETDFAGRRAWEVRMIRPSGDTLFEYFEVESGLSIGGAVTAGSMTGRVRLLTILSEYKAYGTLLLATRVTQRAPEFETVLVIQFVEFDAVREEDLLPPPAVRALKP
jgi:hypothetical protein